MLVGINRVFNRMWKSNDQVKGKYIITVNRWLLYGGGINVNDCE